MIVTISGNPGAGKTTTAKLLAKKLGYKHISMGDLRGRIAMKHNMTIDELNEIGKKEIWTDKEADDELIRMGKEEDNLIIDTWIGYHFVPNSVKIFLKVDPQVGAERIFKNQRPDEPKKETIEEVKEMVAKRVEDSNSRYKKYYNINFLDKSNYDLIIDTTHLTVEGVIGKILEIVDKNSE